MGLWGDERGQAMQVGAVVLFGFLVVAMSAYQASVVPAQNEAVEFAHSQQVQGDLQRVHGAVLRTSATGVRQSTSVALGTTYPPRTLFVNPPPPSGSIRTTGETGARYGIDNAETTGETGDYWNGDVRVVASETLVYAPTYHEYRSPPGTVVEGGMVYNRFGDETIPLTDQSLVHGRTINLVALDGSRSADRGGVTTVDTEPLSVSTTAVPVRSASDGGIVLYVLTMASESAWRTALSDELAAGNVERVRYLSNRQLRAHGGTVDGFAGRDVPLDRGQGAVVVRLNASRTYDLRMAKVGVGSDAETPGAAYLTAVDPLDRGLETGRSDTVVVEVRDRYNNPVSGAEVTVNASSNLAVNATFDDRSDADGRVRYSVTPTATGNASVSFAIGNESFETVPYDRAVPAANGGTGTTTEGRGVVETFPSDYRDRNRRPAIPPETPVGTLSSFSQMRDENGQQAQFNTKWDSSESVHRMRIGVETTGIPTGSAYTFEAKYVVSQTIPVSVQLVDASGNVLQIEQLPAPDDGAPTTYSFRLGDAAASTVEADGRLYVVYRYRGTKQISLYVDYQQIRTYD